MWLALGIQEFHTKASTLKWKSDYFDEIFITESCQNDNFWYNQWWNFFQNDNISISMDILIVVLSSGIVSLYNVVSVSLLDK